MPYATGPSRRALKLMTPKHLKSAEVDFTNAKRGSHNLVETYAGKSNVFRRGANATRVTTVNGEGRATNVTSSYQPGKLTKTGRRTATGLAVAGYTGVAVGPDLAKKRRKVEKSMSVSVWGVDHGEEIAKMREPKKKTPVAQRSALHRPTPYNSRGQNAAKWAAGGAGVGAVYGSAFGARGVRNGAALGAAAGGLIGGRGMPSKNHPNAANMRRSVQQGEDNQYKFKRAKYDAKKAGTWKSQKQGIQNQAMRAEHARVAEYYKRSGNQKSY